MTIRTTALFSLVLAALPLAAHAALPFDVPAPQDGAYFDPSRPGTGYWIDYDADGDAFGAVMTYEPDGRPTFFTFGGKLDLPLFGHYVGLQSAIFASNGGACLGCSWRPPLTTQTPRTFFFRPGMSDATVFGIGPEPFRVSAMPIDENPDDRLAGRWLMALGRNLTDAANSDGLLATVEVEPFDGVVSIAPGEPTDGFAEPAPGARIDRVRCIASCEDFDRWVGGRGDALFAYRGERGILEPYESYALTFGRLDPGGGYIVQRTVQARLIVGTNEAAQRSAWANVDVPPLTRGMRLYRNAASGACDGGAICRDDDGASVRRHVLADTLATTFYDPAQPGAGLFVDAGPEGNTFMTLMTYDREGRSTFHTFGGPLRPVNVHTFINLPGVVSPVYHSTGGQPFGSATYRAPRTEIVPSLGYASVTFPSARSATLAVGGSRYTMVAYEPDGRPLLDRIDDTEWLMALHDRLDEDGDAAVKHERVTARVRFVPDSVLVRRGTNVPADRHIVLPTPSSKVYSVVCAASCGDFGDWLAPRGQGARLLLWSDGTSGWLSQAEAAENGTVVIGADARQYQVQLSDPLISADAEPIPRTDGSFRTNGGQVDFFREPPSFGCSADGDCR